MAVDAVEELGLFLAVPRIVCPGRFRRGNIGLFFGRPNMVIADETCIGAFGGGVDGIAEIVTTFRIARGGKSFERFGAFTRLRDGNGYGHGASCFLRHSTERKKGARERWGRGARRC